MAYIFDPENDGSHQKSAKRRKVSKQNLPDPETAQDASPFVPLLNGAEKPEFVQLRESLFHKSWDKVNDRIEVR